MKTTESKTTTSNLQKQNKQGNQPFFRKDGKGAYFSEVFTDRRSKPFFTPKSGGLGNSSQDSSPFLTPSSSQTNRKDEEFQNEQGKNEEFLSTQESVQRMCSSCEEEDIAMKLQSKKKGPGISEKADAGVPTIQKEEDESLDLGSLARQDFRGCSGEQNFLVDFALLRAPLWVESAIRDLEDFINNPRSTITATESTLNHFFHPRRGRHDPGTVQTIINRLNRILRVLRNPRLFRCVSRQGCFRECGSRTPYACAGPGLPVYICPNFFDLSVNEQLSTLIHESAHRIDLMRNVIPRDRVIQLSLRQALTNAESYALFVTENFTGPPLQESTISSPTPLTENWSEAYMMSEVVLEEPVSGRFYEGRGQRNLISSQQRILEDPFSNSGPVRFRGRVIFYVDTNDVPLPQGTTIPVANAQILFTPIGAGANTESKFIQNSIPTNYVGPQRPLEVTTNTEFDFSIIQNGRLRFTFWLGDEAMDATFDDTIQVFTEEIL